MTRMARGKLSFIGHMESGPVDGGGPQLACHQQTSVYEFRLPHAFSYTDPMTSRSGYGMVFVEITMFSLFPKQKGGFSRNMFILPAVIAMVLGLMYILYRSGFAVMNRKYALLYTEYPRMGKRRSCIEARFLSCSGVTKRVIRLPRSRRYQFVFSSNTTKGSVCVEIYGTQNALMATLNNEQPCLIISTEEKTGYRVVTKFKNADGEYRLIWKECRSPKGSA